MERRWNSIAIALGGLAVLISSGCQVSLIAAQSRLKGTDLDRLTASSTPDLCLTSLKDGTAANPYLIEKAADLDQLNTLNAVGAEFLLCADLTLSQGDYIPAVSFTGNFNGNGHTIDGFTLLETDIVGDFRGFFAKTDSATIHDLTLTNASITVDSQYYDGLLVGKAERSLIYNVSVSGMISGNSPAAVGGITGYALNTVIHHTTTDFAFYGDGSSQTLGGLAGGIYRDDLGLSAAMVYSNNVKSLIRGGRFTGGLAGWVANVEVSRNKIDVDAVTSGGWLGGVTAIDGWIAGTQSVFNDNLVIGSVVGDMGRTGGLGGQISQDSTIVNNVLELSVITASGATAGMIGYTVAPGKTISLDKNVWALRANSVAENSICDSGFATDCALGTNSGGLSFDYLDATVYSGLGGTFADSSVWTIVNGQRPELVGIGYP